MRRRGERGQATVEFALIIPLVVVVLLAIIQVAVVAYAQLEVAHLSREIARSVAVDPGVDIGLLAQELTTRSDDRLGIEVLLEPSGLNKGKFVHVTVIYETPPISRLFEPFTTQFEVSAETKMLVEE